VIVVPLNQAKRSLQALMQRVVEDHKPIGIAHESGEAVVLVSLADWNTMEETTRLLSSPANSARLMAAISQLEGGRSPSTD
jgi:antitoxin YefM